MAPTTRQKRKAEALSKDMMTIDMNQFFPPTIDEDCDYWNRSKKLLTNEHMKEYREYCDKGVNPKVEGEIDEATFNLFKKIDFRKISKNYVRI